MNAKIYRRRRISIIIFIGLAMLGGVWFQASSEENPEIISVSSKQKDNSNQSLARDELEKLPIKGRAPKTGYSRNKFGNGWAKWKNCDTRQKILGRDLTNTKYDDDNCTVLSGTLNDLYTGKKIDFARGAETSSAVQIDHVVALSNAWQTGAQLLDDATREQLANDDLELIAAEGKANQQKSDGDAATWLPSNKAFRCEYVARQIAVKTKYSLWVTQAEYDAIAKVLEKCPDERLPAP